MKLELKKANIIMFYNFTKRSCKRRQWNGCRIHYSKDIKSLASGYFISMLNVTAINARIMLMSFKNPSTQFRNRHFFIGNIGTHSFVSLKEEKLTPVLLRNWKSLIVYHLQKNLKADYTRCAFCPRNNDRKSRFICQKCEKNHCISHLYFVSQNRL